MADNTQLNTNTTSGDIIGTDDIGGVKYQIVKEAWGANGTLNEVDDTTGKRVPVKVGERPVATPTKTGSGSLVSIQTLASAAVVKGELAVTTKLGISLGIRIGRTATTALTNPVKVRVEFSTEDSGDGKWYELFSLLSDTLASTTTSTLTTATTAGTAVLPMTATAGILIGDKLFIKDTVLANSEWSNNVILVTANTSVTIEDNTAINHAITTTQVWSKANVWACPFDVSRYRRIRVVFDAAYAVSGQTVVVECTYTTLDSIV